MKRKLVFITVIAAYVVLAVGFRLAAFNQAGDDLTLSEQQNHMLNERILSYPDPNPPGPPPPPPLDPPG